VLEERAKRFRSWIRDAGFYICGSPEHLSPCFTAVKLKKDDAQEWLKLLKSKYGIIIGKGLGENPDSYLRIGHYPHKGLVELKELATALMDTADHVS
jgi:aspartate aminotransferase-like enzyme